MTQQEKKALVKQDLNDVRKSIVDMQDQFKLALPPHIPAERFARIALTAIQTNQELIKCDRTSLRAALMKCAQDGLLPDGSEAVVLHYWDKKRSCLVATYLPMVRGIMKKARNSGHVSTWSVQVVKANDLFEYQLGDNEGIVHKPAIGQRGETVAVYSIVKLKDGEKSRELMSREDVESVRARSKCPDSGPWVSDFDEMAKKTVIRRHSKRLPMSTDIEGVVNRVDDLYDFNNKKELPTSSPLLAPPEYMPGVLPRSTVEHFVESFSEAGGGEEAIRQQYLTYASNEDTHDWAMKVFEEAKKYGIDLSVQSGSQSEEVHNGREQS